MGMFRKMAKASVASALLNMAVREARKPANQRKVKDLVAQARNSRRPAQGSAG